MLSFIFIFSMMWLTYHLLLLTQNSILLNLVHLFYQEELLERNQVYQAVSYQFQTEHLQYRHHLLYCLFPLILI